MAINIRALCTSTFAALLIFGSFFYGLYWLATFEFSTVVDVTPIPNDELKLSSLNANIKDLKNYLHIIEPSRSLADYPRKLKSYAFLGYISSLVEELFPNSIPDKMAWSLQIISYLDSSISLYKNRLSEAPKVNIDTEIERKVMYFVYLKQSRALFSLSRSNDALTTAEMAIKLASSNQERASALVVYGDVLLTLGEADKALEQYKEAFQLKPKDLSIIKDIVTCHKHIGNMSKNKWKLLFLESEARFLQSESPSCIGESCSSKTPVKGVSEGNFDSEFDEDNEAIDDENILDHIDGAEVFTDGRFSQFLQMKTVMFPTISINHSVPIHGPEAMFQGLFEAAEMAGMYKEAWKYLERRKEVILRELEKDPEFALMLDMSKEMASARYVMDTFKKGFWPTDGASRKVGSTSRLPIFIIGMMRSGSTLLESMLFAHPEILTIGEDSVLVRHIHRFVAQLPSLNGDEDSSEAEIEEEDAYGEWEYEVDMNSDGAPKMPETSATTLDGAINERAELILKGMMTNAKMLFNYTSKYKEGQMTKYVIDKMLMNYMNIGFIHLFFPDALIIHIVRDPLDTAVSCYRMNFGHRNLAWTLKLDSLFNGFRIYLEVVAHFRKELPKRVYEVQYEELVKNPENELRKILNKLGSVMI